jgi:hypothetical protein
MLSGIFFQHQKWLEIGMGPEGSAVFIEEGLCQFAYAGFIYSDRHNLLGACAGGMIDRFGPSVLSEILLLPEDISFNKQYSHSNNPPIKYSLKKQGEFWTGTYSSPKVGTGNTRCLINEIPKDFLSPPPG